MDEILDKLIREVPSLAILGFVVWSFIRYLHQSSVAVSEIHREAMDRVARMTQETHESMRECHATQMRSVAAMERNAEALDRFGEKVDRLSRVVDQGYNGGSI